MKKYLVAFAVIIGMFVATEGLVAAGTVNDWSVSLTFSTDANEDSLEVLVGEGVSLSDDKRYNLKPPSLPGKGFSGFDEDAFIRAGIKQPNETELSSTRIEVTDTTAPAKVWELEVSTEFSSEDVWVDVDIDNLPAEYDFSIIVPETGEFIEFNKTSAKTQLFTSGSAAKKVYLLAGTSKTFATYSDSGTMFGMARLTGRGHTSGTNVKVYNGCSVIEDAIQTLNAGEFEISGLAAGDYHIEITKDNFIGVQCDLNVSLGIYAVACDDLYGGDFNNNQEITLTDLTVMKPIFGATTGDGTYEEKFDLNLDGNVNLSDLTILKPGFGKSQALNCQ